jgi:hypothetical protein
LYDSTYQFVLASDASANFLLADASQASLYTFGTSENLVMSYGTNDTVFYYPDEMVAAGVSRFRHADFEHVPKSAQLVTMMPIQFDSSQGADPMYVAVDTQGDSFYPVLCNVDTSVSNTTSSALKVFLVKDPVNGLDVFNNTDLSYTTFGGAVTSNSCSLLWLTAKNVTAY